MAKGLPNPADLFNHSNPSSSDFGRPSPVSSRSPSFSMAYTSPSWARLRSHRSPSLGELSSHPRKLEGETMFLTEDFPCLFRRTIESSPRSNVEDLVSVSEFLATVAAAFVTVIERNLQSLDFFLRILEPAVTSDHFVEGWAPRYFCDPVRDGSFMRSPIQ